MENRSNILYLGYFCGLVDGSDPQMTQYKRLIRDPHHNIIANRQYWFFQQETSTWWVLERALEKGTSIPSVAMT